ncbi:MAG TPA: lipoyl synthase [Thermodesulfobacteriota bacterium]|nr:lipoyl synthase [Thermodesulfobacteriota bacterium]
MPPEAPGAPLRGKPPWLRARAPGGPNYTRLVGLMRGLALHTVCEEAHCPNIGECWEAGTATFMILGDVCTRRCGFCAVKTGRPTWADPEEPERVAEAVARMGLAHAVVTSVNRDDLPDGGAGVFAATIRAIRRRMPQTSVEVLIPDFRGDAAALEAVLEAGPDILNHNTETVPRLYRAVRPGARYERSLELLARARRWSEERSGGRLLVKSGLMLGLGETPDELRATMRDLVAAGCHILTLGQYLRPTLHHLPVQRYVPPEEFERYRVEGLALGFEHVESGPLVRSSYHAREQVLDAQRRSRPAPDGAGRAGSGEIHA